MIRSRLKNKANKTKRPEDMARYKKQRNFVVSLNKSTRKSFFTNTTNSPKSFWKAIKPYFGGKNCYVEKERILLVENDSIISSEEELAATDSLKIPAIPGVQKQLMIR